MASYLLVALICGGLGFAAIYASRPGSDNGGGTVEPAPGGGQSVVEASAASAGNPLATGEMITFVFKKAPEPVPAFFFADATSAKRSLADFKGKVVLLNLWATWCVPCRKEMPALDRLQKELGGDQFEVVAMSVDRGGAAVSQTFLDEIKVANLKLYTESTSKSVGLLHAPGLPTTLLIDRDGREVGRLVGPAEWDGADAKRLIQSVLK